MFSPIIRSQENNTVSATKVIIETHVPTRHYKKYPERIIKIIQ